MPGRRRVSAATQEWLRQQNVAVLEGGTTTTRVAQELTGVDGLHFIAHGTFNQGRFFLILEDDHGGQSPARTRN